MMKSSIAIVLFCILGLVVLLPMWQQGLYASHDGEIHVARLAQFTQALLDGQFPVRWLRAWFDGMGYPLFVYGYSLPYYVGALLRFVFHLSFVDIFKVLMVGSFLVSGCLQFIFLRRFFGVIASFLGAEFFLFAPYRFADLYDRAALGEAAAFLFIPALFLARGRILWFALVVAGLVTTHLITFALILPFWFVFVLLQGERRWSVFFKDATGFLLGMSLSAFQWMPLFFERGYTSFDSAYQTIYQAHFLPIWTLLKSDSGIQLGLSSIMIFFIASILLGCRVYQKKLEPHILFLFMTILVSVFLILPQSQLLWDRFPPLQFIVFPWRFLIWILFTISFLAAWLAETLLRLSFRRWIIVFGFLILSIFPSRHFLQPRWFETKPDAFYLTFEDPTRLEVYFLPKGISRDFQSVINDRLVVIGGEATVNIIEEKSGRLLAVVDASDDATILVRTLFFPGWVGLVDKKEIRVHNDQGLISFDIPKGLHLLELEFQETRLRRVGDLITLVSFFFIVGWMIRMLPRISIGKKTIPQ